MYCPSNELNKIVAKLYQDRRINEFISKLHPKDLQEDLKSHCFCELYRIAEKYPGKIERLENDQQLFAWFVGMTKMQLMSERSTFYRKHRRQFVDLESLHVEFPECEKPFEFPQIEKQNELLDWTLNEIDKRKSKDFTKPVRKEIFLS